MGTIDLEYFREDLDWLDPDFGPMLTKAAVYCLEDQGHEKGVGLSVLHGGNELRFELDWKTRVDEARAKTLPNEEEMTQKGAECISLLLANQILGLPCFVTAQKGTGVDFWLMTDPDSIFVEAALEVSGIRKASPVNNLNARFQQKKAKVYQAPTANFAYLSVIEFSGPEARFEAI